MKFSTFLLGGVAALALSSGAFAADLIVDVPATEPVAVADTGWYFSVFGGAVWDAVNNTAVEGTDDLDIESNMGWLLGAAVGTHLTDNVRGEIELSGTSRDGDSWTQGDNDGVITDGTASTVALMGNVWLDLDTGSGFTPYIGGGLGVGYIKATSDQFVQDVDGFGLAYQIGAGVKFDVADNVALDLGYRFKGVTADLSGEFGGAPVDNLTTNLGSHVLQVGVTFGF